jgi:hypothetical protein
MDPPRSAEAERWVKHAQKTLDEMKASPPPQSPQTQGAQSSEYPGTVE